MTDRLDRGLIFWPVGNGDSTTVVIDEEHVLQIDLHDTAAADEDGAVVAAVIDELVEGLPERDGQPYLAGFALSHADQDHCRGFATLLASVHIGEIWGTPRLWREYADDDGESLCADALAFKEECDRRITATLAAIEDGKEPASGDRIRIIGSDDDKEEHEYASLPREYISYPGETVTQLDGAELDGVFAARILAPFKDDCAAARNDTSLAMQVTLTCGEEVVRVLLFGDLAHETLTRILDVDTELSWNIILSPHHCSKKAMYDADGNYVPEVIDGLDACGSEPRWVIASSMPIPADNDAGDNPPHAKAKARYLSLLNDDANFICTAEHPSADAPQPVTFVLSEDGITLVESIEKASAGRTVTKGILIGLASLGAAYLATRRRPARQGPTAAPAGAADARAALERIRGAGVAPVAPVGFGGE